MKSTPRRLASLSLLAALTVGVSATAGAAGKSIAWQTNLAKAEAMAAKQHKILMVDFYGEY